MPAPRIFNWFLGACLPAERAVLLKQSEKRRAAGLVIVVSQRDRLHVKGGRAGTGSRGDVEKAETHPSVQPYDNLFGVLVLLVGGGEEPKVKVVRVGGIFADWQLTSIRFPDVEIDLWNTGTVDGKL